MIVKQCVVLFLISAVVCMMRATVEGSFFDDLALLLVGSIFKEQQPKAKLPIAPKDDPKAIEQSAPQLESDAELPTAPKSDSGAIGQSAFQLESRNQLLFTPHVWRTQRVIFHKNAFSGVVAEPLKSEALEIPLNGTQPSNSSPTNLFPFEVCVDGNNISDPSEWHRDWGQPSLTLDVELKVAASLNSFETRGGRNTGARDEEEENAKQDQQVDSFRREIPPRELEEQRWKQIPPRELEQQRCVAVTPAKIYRALKKFNVTSIDQVKITFSVLLDRLWLRKDIEMRIVIREVPFIRRTVREPGTTDAMATTTRYCDELVSPLIGRDCDKFVRSVEDVNQSDVDSLLSQNNEKKKRKADSYMTEYTVFSRPSSANAEGYDIRAWCRKRESECPLLESAVALRAMERPKEPAFKPHSSGSLGSSSPDLIKRQVTLKRGSCWPGPNQLYAPLEIPLRDTQRQPAEAQLDQLFPFEVCFKLDRSSEMKACFQNKRRSLTVKVSASSNDDAKRAELVAKNVVLLNQHSAWEECFAVTPCDLYNVSRKVNVTSIDDVKISVSEVKFVAATVEEGTKMNVVFRELSSCGCRDGKCYR